MISSYPSFEGPRERCLDRGREGNVLVVDAGVGR